MRPLGRAVPGAALSRLSSARMRMRRRRRLTALRAIRLDSRVCQCIEKRYQSGVQVHAE